MRANILHFKMNSLIIIIFIAMASTLVQSENHVKIKNELIQDIQVEKRSANTEEGHVKNDGDQQTSQTTITETNTESNTEQAEETVSREETQPTKITSSDEDNISTTSSNEIESTVEMKTTSKTITKTSTTTKPKRMILPKPVTIPTIIDILEHVKSDIGKIHTTIVEPALDFLRFPPLGHDILRIPINHHKLQKRKTTRLDFDKTLPCSSEGYFRLNHSCTEFYRCKIDEFSQKTVSSHIYTCHPCLVFNAKKQKCDFPENVPECNLYDDNKTMDFCTGTGNFSIYEDCQKYYECKEGKNGSIELKVKTCPGTTTFNARERKCVEENECVPYPTCETPHIKLADKYNCHKFYHCTANKTPVLFYCPDDTIFNGQYCEMFDNSIGMGSNNSPLTIEN